MSDLSMITIIIPIYRCGYYIQSGGYLEGVIICNCNRQQTNSCNNK